MRTFYIYKVTDKTNGKLYIGCTKDFEKRKQQHLRLSERDKCLFHDMIKEHGAENFEWKVIKTVSTQEEAHRTEQYYIRELDTIFPNGYNMTIGGLSHSLVHSNPIVCLTLEGEYVKRYTSAAQVKYEDGYCHSDVLDCCKGRIGRCKDRVFMFEQDYLDNGPRIYRKPEPNGMKSIVQCDLQGNFVAKYKSVNEAAEQTNSCRTTISGCLIGDYKSANGFIFVYEEDFPIKDMGKYKRTKKGRKIAQIDIATGETIKTFDRIADAGRELNVCYKNIHKVLDKPNLTAFGFKWVSI